MIIRMWAFLLIFILTLSSCVTNVTPKESIEVLKQREEVSILVENFDQILRNKGFTPKQRLLISFQEIEVPVGYKAVFASCGGYQLNVDPRYWDTHSPLIKEAIIYHELGHCYFNAFHISEGSCKTRKTLMCAKTNHINLKEYEKNPNAFIDDLMSFANNKTYEIEKERIIEGFMSPGVEGVKVSRKDPEIMFAIESYFKLGNFFIIKDDQGHYWITKKRPL